MDTLVGTRSQFNTTALPLLLLSQSLENVSICRHLMIVIEVTVVEMLSMLHYVEMVFPNPLSYIPPSASGSLLPVILRGFGILLGLS